MAAITKFAEPAELFFQPARSRSRLSLHEAQPIQPASMRETQPRLWKLTTQGVSSRFARFESFVLLLLLGIAVVVMSSCFIQLSHLLQSDAILHTVIKAIAAVG